MNTIPLYSTNRIREIIKTYILARREDDNVPDFVLSIREKIQKDPKNLTPNQHRKILLIEKINHAKDYLARARSKVTDTSIQGESDGTGDILWVPLQTQTPGDDTQWEA